MDVQLAAPELGDVLVVLDCGAYGFAQSSRYNSLPRPGEILIDNGIPYVIRERERYEHLNELAHVPAHLDARPSANRAGAHRAVDIRVLRQTVPSEI